MTKIIYSLTLALGVYFAPVAMSNDTTKNSAANDVKYGVGADMAKLTAIDSILANPTQYLDKTVTVKGEVKAVCKKRGCWMELAAANNQDVLKIKVKDGEIVFPVSTKGKTAYATGVLKGKELNLEQTRAYYQHVAEEQKHAFDPASIKQGMTLYQLATVGATIAE